MSHLRRDNIRPAEKRSASTPSATKSEFTTSTHSDNATVRNRATKVLETFNRTNKLTETNGLVNPMSGKLELIPSKASVVETRRTIAAAASASPTDDNAGGDDSGSIFNNNNNNFAAAEDAAIVRGEGSVDSPAIPIFGRGVGNVVKGEGGKAIRSGSAAGFASLGAKLKHRKARDSATPPPINDYRTGTSTRLGVRKSELLHRHLQSMTSAVEAHDNIHAGGEEVEVGQSDNENKISELQRVDRERAAAQTLKTIATARAGKDEIGKINPDFELNRKCEERTTDDIVGHPSPSPAHVVVASAYKEILEVEIHRYKIKLENEYRQREEARISQLDAVRSELEQMAIRVHEGTLHLATQSRALEGRERAAETHRMKVTAEYEHFMAEQTRKHKAFVDNLTLEKEQLSAMLRERDLALQQSLSRIAVVEREYDALNSTIAKFQKKGDAHSLAVDAATEELKSARLTIRELQERLEAKEREALRCKEDKEASDAACVYYMNQLKDCVRQYQSLEQRVAEAEAERYQKDREELAERTRRFEAQRQIAAAFGTTSSSFSPQALVGSGDGGRLLIDASSEMVEMRPSTVLSHQFLANLNATSALKRKARESLYFSDKGGSGERLLGRGHDGLDPKSVLTSQEERALRQDAAYAIGDDVALLREIVSEIKAEVSGKEKEAAAAAKKDEDSKKRSAAIVYAAGYAHPQLRGAHGKQAVVASDRNFAQDSDDQGKLSKSKRRKRQLETEHRSRERTSSSERKQRRTAVNRQSSENGKRNRRKDHSLTSSSSSGESSYSSNQSWGDNKKSKELTAKGRRKTTRRRRGEKRDGKEDTHVDDFGKGNNVFDASVSPASTSTLNVSYPTSSSTCTTSEYEDEEKVKSARHRRRSHRGGSSRSGSNNSENEEILAQHPPRSGHKGGKKRNAEHKNGRKNSEVGVAEQEEEGLKETRGGGGGRSSHSPSPSSQSQPLLDISISTLSSYSTYHNNINTNGNTSSLVMNAGEPPRDEGYPNDKKSSHTPKKNHYDLQRHQHELNMGGATAGGGFGFIGGGGSSHYHLPTPYRTYHHQQQVIIDHHKHADPHPHRPPSPVHVTQSSTMSPSGQQRSSSIPYSSTSLYAHQMSPLSSGGSVGSGGIARPGVTTGGHHPSPAKSLLARYKQEQQQKLQKGRALGQQRREEENGPSSTDHEGLVVTGVAIPPHALMMAPTPGSRGSRPSSSLGGHHQRSGANVAVSGSSRGSSNSSRASEGTSSVTSKRFESNTKSRPSSASSRIGSPPAAATPERTHNTSTNKSAQHRYGSGAGDQIVSSRGGGDSPTAVVVSPLTSAGNTPVQSISTSNRASLLAEGFPPATVSSPQKLQQELQTPPHGPYGFRSFPSPSTISPPSNTTNRSKDMATSSSAADSVASFVEGLRASKAQLLATSNYTENDPLVKEMTAKIETYTRFLESGRFS